jgi:hypothetical protein
LIEVERNQFFFEKNNQKTTAPLACAGETAVAYINKSFLVLFFKKELLPCLD